MLLLHIESIKYLFFYQRDQRARDIDERSENIADAESGQTAQVQHGKAKTKIGKQIGKTSVDLPTAVAETQDKNIQQKSDHMENAVECCECDILQRKCCPFGIENMQKRITDSKAAQIQQAAGGTSQQKVLPTEADFTGAVLNQMGKKKGGNRCRDQLKNFSGQLGRGKDRCAGI